MIDLYYWPTPNGEKVPIFLEEAEIEYQVKLVSLAKGAQFAPEFLAVSPNNKIPAIIDHRPLDRGQPISIFESGAILIYLADKTGRFLSLDIRKRTETLQWLLWQTSGLAPIAGQDNHFSHLAPEKIHYAIEHFRKETYRLFGVLNKKLEGRDFIAGDYSIADMAAYPWIVSQEIVSQFPNIKRWSENIRQRPAVQRAYQLAEGV